MGIDIHRLPNIKGRSIEEASSILEPYGIKTIRVKLRDGKPQMVTADMRADRLNVSLANNIISGVIGLG